MDLTPSIHVTSIPPHTSLYSCALDACGVLIESRRQQLEHPQAGEGWTRLPPGPEIEFHLILVTEEPQQQANTPGPFVRRPLLNVGVCGQLD